MKLFGDFEAVKFHEENLIFVTHGGYLYYIFNPKYNFWRKHSNAGNDHITVNKYDDVGKEELINAMGGKFPEKETDFMRLCNPSQLCIRDMLDLLKEDYEKYMSDYSIYHSVHTEILRQYFINHPQSIDKYTFLQNSAFTHWVKEKCSKMC